MAEIDFNAVVAKLVDPDGDGVKSLFFRNPRVPEDDKSDPVDLLATERGFTHVGAYVGHSNWRRVNELPELPSSISAPADSATVREFFLSVERRAAAAAAQNRPGTPSNWAEAMERYTDALGGLTDTLKSIQAHAVADLLKSAPFGAEVRPDAVQARIARLNVFIAEADSAIGRSRYEYGYDGDEGPRRDRLIEERSTLATLLQRLVDPALRAELDAFVATRNASSST